MMQTQTHTLAAVVLLLIVHGLAIGAGDESPSSKPFPVASVRFEQNATDGDVEVVFDIIGGDDGLATLTVVSPDGRTVADFAAPDSSTMGIRQFVFESPEPTDVDGLKAAYPEGEYTFTGATTAGVQLHGTATLSHELPPTVSFLHPAERAQDVNLENLEITWTPVENVAGYVIELEQSKLDVQLTSKQPASMAKFAVPSGLLAPGTKYHLGIGTVSDEGNVSFVETTFTTAETR